MNWWAAASTEISLAVALAAPVKHRSAFSCLVHAVIFFAPAISPTETEDVIRQTKLSVV
jgi:hypothetical protein